jgi:hypothetical protein
MYDTSAHAALDARLVPAQLHTRFHEPSMVLPVSSILDPLVRGAECRCDSACGQKPCSPSLPPPSPHTHMRDKPALA